MQILYVAQEIVMLHEPSELDSLKCVIMHVFFLVGKKLSKIFIGKENTVIFSLTSHGIWER